MYYVWPRIEVAGTLHLNGEEIEVSGQAWMDREWGSSLLMRNKPDGIGLLCTSTTAQI